MKQELKAVNKLFKQLPTIPITYTVGLILSMPFCLYALDNNWSNLSLICLAVAIAFTTFTVAIILQAMLSLTKYIIRQETSQQQQ